MNEVSIIINGVRYNADESELFPTKEELLNSL